MELSYSWNSYFMSLAYLVSMKSKDPSTRVGAVIVGQSNEIRGTGYNGLPRGIRDAKNRYDNKNFKYLAQNHAEENAILNCARVGVATNACRIYTPWLPCSYCAKSIIQSGIHTVIYDKKFPGNDKEKQSNYWYDSMKIAIEIFLESGIKIVEFSDELINTSGLYRGNSFTRE